MLLINVIITTINNVLLSHRGNQTKAAKELGISRGTLRKYMKPEYKPRTIKKEAIEKSVPEPKKKVSYGTLRPQFHPWRGLKR